MGTRRFSHGWNRRRGRRGHVFQGRYKAVVVDGEEAEWSYFKIVADYIHLNPVRSGWVCAEKRDDEGLPLRDHQSTTYLAGFESPSDFGI